MRGSAVIPGRPRILDLEAVPRPRPMARRDSSGSFALDKVAVRVLLWERFQFPWSVPACTRDLLAWPDDRRTRELSGSPRHGVTRLNGGSVSEKTRRRVQAVLGETNYRPNLAARSLASGRSNVIGVVMHIDPHLLFEDPYFSQLMQG